jgi:phosphoribosylpyrophosphate synthetase
VAIDAIATHGLFPHDSLSRIEAQGLLGSVAVTDSHPRAVELCAAHPGGFLRVESIARLMIEHLNANR